MELNLIQQQKKMPRIITNNITNSTNQKKCHYYVFKKSYYELLDTP